MKRWVGVDLHKRQFTVCWLSARGEKMEEYEVSEAGYEQFKKKLRSGDEIGVEAIGNSGYFREKIRERVNKVVVINPKQFKVISESVKKTDENDARAIAKYLKHGLLPEVRQMSKERRELRSLIHTRDKLVKLRSSLKNKIHNTLNDNGIVSRKEMFSSEVSYERLKELSLSETVKFEIEIIVKQIKSLGENIKEMEGKIKEIGNTMDGHKNLKSITGIGDLSAAIILNGIGKVEDFDDSKKLSSYVGLVPRIKNSADKESSGGHITRMGNKILRTTLVQVTLIAIKYNDYLRRFYLRLKEKKCSGKAIIATARKMLDIIYRTLKNGWVFADFNNWVLE
ncbi:MAG: IS110 family transposase [Endomicrobia bacterium]|nr:IS110 family transposase [Endomicrobiia bacterium]